MVRIAVSCLDAVTRLRLRKALERYAAEVGMPNVEVGAFVYASDLVKTMCAMRPGFCDFAVFSLDGDDRPDEQGNAAPVIDAVRLLHARYPDMPLGLVSSQRQDVMHAFELDAGFLSLDGTYADFKRMVGEPFDLIAQRKAACISVRSANGVDNVPLEAIQFVETSKRGPIIHLPEGQTVVARGTLQQLFEVLSQWRSETAGETSRTGDTTSPASSVGNRFVKAGSSFIVNLDNVRSVGEGAFIFSDGEAVIVPIRKRKDLKDAWTAYRAG